MAQAPDKVRGIKFRRNYGKSPALFCGFEQAQGDVVITMDADLQDSPDEIPELYRMITQDGYDLVSGWKQKRYDPLSKTLPTKLFNATARKVSGIKNLHDFNCGLKAYRKEVVKNIEVYGEMHRYIPYLAKNAGFKKIGEKVVHHQARKYGKTKFGLNRFVNGYLDLLSLWFLSRFGIKPMHFFGLLGSLMFIFGFIAVVIVGVSKLYYMHHGMPYRLVTDSPYFYLSLTSMIIGTQLFVAGFLGEPIVSIAISCSEEADCSMTARSMVNCILYRVDPETQYVENDTLDSLTVTAYGTDSIIINNQKKVHDISLPLRYTEDSTKLIFKYSRNKSDTMVIRHTNTPYFLSMDCGYQMKQAITDVTCTRISLDSIYIKDNEAGIYGKENLKLFY